jgi:MFS family permease
MRSRIFEGITRNILVLGVVSLFTDLSSQMVFPLVPLFLTSVLGAGAYAVGIVEGAAETTASLLKVVSGYWCDRINRRKPFVLFGYSLSTITKPLFAFANVWTFVLFVRVLERIGKGLRTAPRDAIVADCSEERYRGKAYGFHRTMDGIGSTLGGVMAFLLLSMVGYRKVFLLAFIPGVIGALAVLFVREARTPAQVKCEVAPIKISFKELPVNLRVFIVVSSVFALGQFGYAFLLLRAKSIGLPDSRAILLYVLFYVAYSVFGIPSGILSDRIGRKPVLVGGYVLFALTCIALMLTSTMYGVLFCFLMYGVFFALIDGVQRAFVVDLAPEHMKGTALGTFHTAIGLVALPGGYVAGLLWDKIGPKATFSFGLVLAVIGLVLFAFVKPGKRGNHE